jgi:DNA-binding LacI/PurR family transcriptional regulator/DNA-binding transcriptional regulator YhcF (GntR family)
VRQLCAELGASATTVTRALKALHAEGVLKVHPAGHRGYYPKHFRFQEVAITGRGIPEAQAALMQAIRSQIATGSLNRGDRLDSRRHYRRTYGCSYARITRALEALVHEGLLEHRGRSYVVALGEKSQAKGRARVHVLAGRGALRSYHRHVFSMILRMERETADIGWENLTVVLGDDGGQATAPAEHLTAGIVHLALGSSDPWETVLATQRKRLPLIIMTNNHDSAVRRVRRFPWATVLSIDNTYAGFAMARALKERRHCVFFSHMGLENQWLRERLAGVREVFSHGGKTLELRGLHGGSVAKDERHRRIRSRLKGLNERLSSLGSLEPFVIHEATQSIHDLVHLDQIHSLLKESFSPTLKEGKADLWLCMNDDIAAMALRFLKENSVDVPGRVAVAGFDNTPLSHVLGLTTYDFAFDRMGQMAIRALAHPALLPSQKDGPVPVRGGVVKRRTA